MAQVLVGIPISAVGDVVPSSLPSELGCLPAILRNECLDMESVGARADLFQLDELAEMNEGTLSNFFLSVTYSIICTIASVNATKLFITR